MSDTVEVRRRVHADPQQVWTLVSDLTRMGEWSPEATGGRWLGDASGPSVGARFKGSNRRGWRRWGTISTVRESTPGEVFAFDADALGLGIARWEYHLEADGDGCVVTERWVDRRGGAMRLIGRVVSGVGDRAEHNREGMEATLRRLAETVEASSSTD